MSWKTGDPLIGARNGAILALILSLLALALPVGMGGYNDWGDWHLAIHNLAAVLVRVAIFAAIGAAFADIWGRLRHRHKPHTTR